MAKSRYFSLQFEFMTKATLIHNARLVNEGKTIVQDVLISAGRIEHIGPERRHSNAEEIDAGGMVLMPGIIDDQVHFREPGLTHKADIASESRAGLAGGVTSFMEMPNTVPHATTQDLLEEKYAIASKQAYSNYSFYLGATDLNLDEIKRVDSRWVCGVKIFMGSSTGDLLVANDRALEGIFRESPILIATHCEDETMYRQKQEEYRVNFCDEIPASAHEFIRSAEGCLASSSKAVHLARQFGSRLHILHISTLDELPLFTSDLPLDQKKITAEVCVHHLFLDSSQYATLHNKIKCNPSIKHARHREALMKALRDGRLDVVATDHAPHSLPEKTGSYLQSASGLPLIQHSLQIMLTLHHDGLISLEEIVTKMCHHPAVCFKVKDRGFIREGYHADLVLVNPDERVLVTRENVFYKCGWSPLENFQLRGEILSTWVNGSLAYHRGTFNPVKTAQRLEFER